MPTYSVPAGVPTIITQNIVYALPARSCFIIGEPDCEVAQSSTGPWSAAQGLPVGKQTAASFIRCTTANAVVTCKLM